MIIDVAGLPVELSRKRIKNLNLRINHQGEVKVSAPLRLPLDLIHRYLNEKRDWIDTHRIKLQAQPPICSLKFETGESHFFLGKRYDLIVHTATPLNHITIDEQSIYCFINYGATVIERQTLLQQWYRQQMHGILPNLIKKWEEIIGVQVQTYHIKVMKTRWGSCNSSKQRVSLNLNLIQKPLNCLEYVIVHELVHLLEASHNSRFYALMSQFMPDWKYYKKQLTCPI
ncbi:MAG: hypothetical protein A3E88_05010 [Legionellales bacterium RIFCSPHIGHO2_12_FULL_35_11]|nr:MAG: hypothetical protein A3E88_05010 [Legionellales bacterium RIFCSPHIGHO2_12_FULL_35_11]